MGRGSHENMETRDMSDTQNGAVQETSSIVRSSDNVALNAFSNESSFETAQRMAKALSSSTLVPPAYQGNIANCLIAMELANRIGMSVFMVCQSLNIVYGKPSFSSQFLIGTVNSCGRFTPLRFRYSGEGDQAQCVAVATDKRSGEELIGPEVSIAMAKAEGWYDRKSRSGESASKWPTMPRVMMTYRAASFWTRIYAPDLSLGMRTVEESIDEYIEGARATDVVEQRLQSLQPAQQIPEIVVGVTNPSTGVSSDPPAKRGPGRPRKDSTASVQVTGAVPDTNTPTGEAAPPLTEAAYDPGEGKRPTEQLAAATGHPEVSASPEHRVVPPSGVATQGAPQVPTPQTRAAIANNLPFDMPRGVPAPSTVMASAASPAANEFAKCDEWNQRQRIGATVRTHVPGTGEVILTTTASIARVFGGTAVVNVNDGKGSSLVVDLKTVEPWNR